jgi:hypothetical protein
MNCPKFGAPLAHGYLKSNIANYNLLVGSGYESSIILPRLVDITKTHLYYLFLSFKHF